MQGNEIESILKSCQCKCKLSEQVDKTCTTVHVWFYLSLKVSTDMNITSFLKTFNRRSSSHCKYCHTSETLFWLKGTTGSPTIQDFRAISFSYRKEKNITGNTVYIF